MDVSLRVGDRVQIRLDSETWQSQGWFDGTVIRIDPYSQHRSFYWVELDQEVEAAPGKGVKLLSVFNPKNIRRPVDDH